MPAYGSTTRLFASINFRRSAARRLSAQGAQNPSFASAVAGKIMFAQSTSTHLIRLLPSAMLVVSQLKSGASFRLQAVRRRSNLHRQSTPNLDPKPNARPARFLFPTRSPSLSSARGKEGQGRALHSLPTSQQRFSAVRFSVFRVNSRSGIVRLLPGAIRSIFLNGRCSYP